MVVIPAERSNTFGCNSDTSVELFCGMGAILYTNVLLQEYSEEVFACSSRKVNISNDSTRKQRQYVQVIDVFRGDDRVAPKINSPYNEGWN